MKETKGRRRKRVFSGMNIADLRLLKEHKALPRGMKAEELEAEIARRGKIADGTKGQNRVRGRFAGKKAHRTLEERLKLDPGKAVSFEDRVRRIVREEQGKVATTEEANVPEARPKWVDDIGLYRRLLREELSAKSRNKPGLLQRLKRWLL